MPRTPAPPETDKPAPEPAPKGRGPVSMREVAARAGVSTATVSNVLSGRKAVDPLLAERVRAAAAALDYRVDRAASQLRSGKARVVAVLVPSLENPFFTSIVAGLERAANREGYDIIVASANDDEAIEAARLAALLSWRPSGVIVIPSTDAFPGRRTIEAAGVPYVVVDRVAADDWADAVMVDNAGAARLAADHLLGLGHARVLVAASSLRLANIRERCDGIAAAFARSGLDAPEITEVGLTFDTVAARLDGRLAAFDRPSAILALTNFATLGVLAALSRLAIRVPDDVSLVGFDDYAWMRAAAPSITAVRQPVDRMAEEAWQRLLGRLAGESGPPLRLRLPCSLEVRASTTRLRATADDHTPIHAREALDAAPG